MLFDAAPEVYFELPLATTSRSGSSRSASSGCGRRCAAAARCCSERPRSRRVRPGLPPARGSVQGDGRAAPPRCARATSTASSTCSRPPSSATRRRRSPRKDASAFEVTPGVRSAGATALRAAGEITRVRRELFVGFGSCSAQEPIDGLTELGFLASVREIASADVLGLLLTRLASSPAPSPPSPPPLRASLSAGGGSPLGSVGWGRSSNCSRSATRAPGRRAPLPLEQPPLGVPREEDDDAGTRPARRSPRSRPSPARACPSRPPPRRRPAARSRCPSAGSRCPGTRSAAPCRSGSRPRGRTRRARCRRARRRSRR